MMQFYSAFHHCLRRQALLDPGLDLSVSRTERNISRIKVAKNGSGIMRDWWGGLKDVMEFTASLGKHKSDKATVRFYKHYVWSPWDVSLMEDCDVLTYNIALHYFGRTSAFEGRNHHAFVDDVRAAVDFLSNFSSSRSGRVAIWRETLPQHFRTETGAYAGTGKPQLSGCAAIPDGVHGTQGFNNETLMVFAEMCNCSRRVTGRENLENGTLCLAHECTVDHTATNVSYESVFVWEAQSNRTHHGNHERSALTKSGRIYWWPLFDVFDVPSWHKNDVDCSHFCFIPQLYEAGFSRLSDILMMT